MEDLQSWLKRYVKKHKKNANHLVNNKINWHTNQGGMLSLKVKNVEGNSFRLKTSIRGKDFVLKLYDMPRYNTYNGVWANITKKQALILARELLIYVGKGE
ncbi:MAG: hypothetical protein CBD97_01655 [Pelagibacteraceae bacterium TMED237]|nr:MAG: hypothetical protein CBD97_01655 [Pelagibacteraceae bacterium TMED237]|tara:strand:- start:19727 stop:20029 length:303 start_codon:yes stop_codon:yes gene_type:complete